ncbi:MAG: hypothetical protein WBH03_09610 [Cyclobacteriaceae bacterium]
MVLTQYDIYSDKNEPEGCLFIPGQDCYVNEFFVEELDEVACYYQVKESVFELG